MNETLKQIVRVLEEGTPELQVAAAQVLGELKPKAPAVTRALASQLNPGETVRTRFVLEALAKIGTKEAVGALVEALHQGGATAELVGHLLGRMGSEVTQTLNALFDEADPELRHRILEILGKQSDRDALNLLRKAVLGNDPALSRKAAEVLKGHLADLDDKQRDMLRASLQKSLSAKSAMQLTPDALAQGVLVIGSLNGASCRATLMKFTAPKYPPIVRQAAFRALDGVPLTQNQADTVLGYLHEGDMTHVVRPAMHLLSSIDRWSSGSTTRLKKMISSANEELRLFALRALHSCHTAEMAKISMKHLVNGDVAFQRAAAAALGENPAAVDGLLKAFQSERNPERARLIAEPLGRLGRHFDRSQIRSLADKAGKLLANREPMGDVFLDLLLAVDPAASSRELVDKAVRQRRAKKLGDCLTILMRLAQTDRMEAEGRYQLAVARLLSDMEDKRVESRETGNATMGYFARLVREGFPVLDRLKKEGQVGPEALLRVAGHFAGGVGQERRFGTELLQYVAQKHGRHQAGADAKMMLRSAAP